MWDKRTIEPISRFAHTVGEGGIFLLHTIGSGDNHYSSDRWIEKYIFPNGVLPLSRGIVNNCNGLFTIEDWHNIGQITILR
ncbi:MAG: hypothetical protein Ct9H300mP14_04420 [Gammaproteobacteria bacterium]|nr:MAG: hypothetical protein Ct9H300mP14_04420 [Gammaproteobacteria bacterium]